MSRLILASSRVEVRERWSAALADAVAVETAADLGALTRCAQAQGDALILLDMSLPGLNGLGGVRDLRTAHGDLRLFCFSDLPSEDEGLELLALGACGYANTFLQADAMRQALAVVEAGQVWLGQRLMQALIRRTAGSSGTDAGANPALARLTEREREIAEVLAEGVSNKIIARRLNITERTVKAHLTSIFDKTGTHDRLELALLIQGHIAGRRTASAKSTA